MNRRDFLSRFAQTSAGALVVHTLDVDKLLWVAGERTIFLPPVRSLTFNGFPVYLNPLADSIYFLSSSGVYRCDYNDGSYIKAISASFEL